MKKFYILTIVLVLLITITGCGKTKNKEPEKTEFTLGEKIEIKNFEIEFLNYSLRKAITEKEKHQDQLSWVGLMNNYKSCAEEIVLQELIYNYFL